MREMNFTSTDDKTHFLWLQSVSPCLEQWACGALTGKRPSHPRDVIVGIISKEHHGNVSEREKCYHSMVKTQEANTKHLRHFSVA